MLAALLLDRAEAAQPAQTALDGGDLAEVEQEELLLRERPAGELVVADLAEQVPILHGTAEIQVPPLELPQGP